MLELTPDRKRILVGFICFCDSAGDDGISGVWSHKDDYVKGGRLGRNHTLSDVPNHFVRDFLLEQIDEKVDEAEALDETQRQIALRALFSDLTADQLSEYREFFAKKREAEQRAYRAKYGIPEEDATPEEIRKCELRRIMLDYGFKHEREAEAVVRLYDAVEAVDTSVDLTPRVRPGVTRNYQKYGPLRRSVIFPGIQVVGRGETVLPLSMEIDRDCDQIRLMIRRFCFWEKDYHYTCYKNNGEFELEDFVTALGITRQTLAAFLKKKGPENGDKSQAYELAWEFFKRRELLGDPLDKEELMKRRFDAEGNRSVDSDDGGDDEDAEEVDMDRASGSDQRPSKRQNDEEDPAEGRNKRTKTATGSRRRSERLKR